MLVRTEKIDPETYPFRHHIEANKHLDTDEDRHKIQCIVETINDHYNGREHLFCDKDQLRDGKFRIPKKLQEAQARGFKTIMEMYEADKKEADEKKAKEDQAKSKMIDTLQQQLIDTIATIKTQQEKNDERFDKLLNLILSQK